ncbi:MAG: hypothetical protein ACP5JF_06385 [Candidatus Methanodesulfokora sp.]
MSLEEKIERWRKLEEEAREIRRKEADWSFINSQPPRIKAALTFYVETGDMRLASRIAEMGIEEFRELLRSAKIPVVV